MMNFMREKELHDKVAKEPNLIKYFAMACELTGFQCSSEANNKTFSRLHVVTRRSQHKSIHALTQNCVPLRRCRYSYKITHRTILKCKTMFDVGASIFQLPY